MQRDHAFQRAKIGFIKTDISARTIAIRKIADRLPLHKDSPFPVSYTHLGQRLGVIGEIHPEVAENYGIDERVYCFTLDVDLLFANAKTDKTYTPLPKFPAVTRDLALLCDDAIPVLDLEKAIVRGAGNLLEKIKLFDVYKGAQIEAGKKSVAFNIVLRSSDSTPVSYTHLLCWPLGWSFHSPAPTPHRYHT